MISKKKIYTNFYFRINYCSKSQLAQKVEIQCNQLSIRIEQITKLGDAKKEEVTNMILK